MAAPANVPHAHVPDRVLQSLWTHLLPNDEARVSPEIANTQHCIIANGDQRPVRKNGALAITPIPSQRWLEITDAWNTFTKMPKRWHCNPYDTLPHFLDGYFLYYGSRNSLAIQFALMDLLRWGNLPTCLHVLDVGVGPATATLGLFEFLRKLALACRAAEAQFPITDINVWILDRSPKVLNYAISTLQYYARSLSPAPNDPVLSKVQNWACTSPQCIHLDLGNSLSADLPCTPNLLVFSNVVSDVLFIQEQPDTSFGALVHRLQPGGSVILTEHPVYRERLQCWLDKWAALQMLHVPDCRLRRRSQTFRPHSLFGTMLAQTSSLIPCSWRFTEPQNSMLVWDQGIFVKPAN